MIWLRSFVLLVLAACIATPSSAHELEPGYGELRQIAADSYRVFWRQPDVRGRPMGLELVLPATCAPRQGNTPTYDGRAWASTWVSTCAAPMVGQKIAIDGLATQNTDVLLRISSLDGRVTSQRLTPEAPEFLLSGAPGSIQVLFSYLPLGVSHILEGFDHLLFVFALLLLISGRWKLLGAITAFTVAHSITMAVATMGLVALPGPPVEAVIALSIVFLASELMHKGEADLRMSERYPWAVSFSFGLLHGFGFAGALAEIGLPDTDIPLALFSFNLGVELGQLIFVAAVLVTAWLIKRFAPASARGWRPGTQGWQFCVYLIGGVSSYWLLERLAGF